MQAGQILMPVDPNYIAGFLLPRSIDSLTDSLREVTVGTLIDNQESGHNLTNFQVYDKTKGFVVFGPNGGRRGWEALPIKTIRSVLPVPQLALFYRAPEIRFEGDTPPPPGLIFAAFQAMGVDFMRVAAPHQELYFDPSFVCARVVQGGATLYFKFGRNNPTGLTLTAFVNDPVKRQLATTDQKAAEAVFARVLAPWCDTSKPVGFQWEESQRNGPEPVLHIRSSLLTEAQIEVGEGIFNGLASNRVGR